MLKENNSRRLYLIRHCHTSGDGRCISATDLPLDDFGEHQADNLARWVSDKRLGAVYSSPLCRAVKTAERLGVAPVVIRSGLREVNVGAWENLTFDEIKNLYSEDFLARGKNPGTSAPTGGESIKDAGFRLLDCLRGIVAETDSDVAVVSHGGALRGLVCALLGRDIEEAPALPLPWGSVSELEVSPDGCLSVISFGEMPERFPDERSAEWLRMRYGMLEHVRAHCNAVAAYAILLASKITAAVNLPLLKSAAQLHDISRAKGFSHAVEGARLLRESGYPDVAEIIKYHHDLPEDAHVEAQLLYLADKLVQETRAVSLRERFEGSRQKCLTPEALDAWQRRYDAAKNVARALGLEALCDG